MLSKYLNKDNIKLNIEAENWKDAVKKAGKILVKNKAAEEKYIKAMLEMVESNGAYIVISPGLAIPHARPENGAKKNGLALLTLDNTVEFGHPKNDPVKTVIAFCAADDSSHTEMISTLAKFLNKKDNREFLSQVKDKKILIDYIEKYDRGGE